MTDDTPTPVPLAREATVEGDVPCIACGYNLRTLSMNGRCPECGGEILKSFRRSWLIFTDPGWLSRLRTGVTIILWMLLAGVISYFAMIAVFVATFIPTGQPHSPFLLMGIVLFFGLGFTTIWLISLGYLTTREPSHDPNEATRRTVMARWILGLSAMPIGSTLALLPMIYLLFSYTNVVFNWSIVILMVIVYAGAIALNVGYFLLMIYMRRIARRDSRKGLGKMMSFLIWGMVGMTVLGFGWSLMIALSALTAARMASTSTAVSTTAPAAWGGFPYATTTTGPSGIPTTNPSVWVNQGPGNVTTTFNAPGVGPAGIVINTSATTQAAMTQVATSMPVGGSVPFPFGGGLPMIGFLIVAWIIELFAFAWIICAVVALFWFRSTFSRSIRENVSSLYIWV